MRRHVFTISSGGVAPGTCDVARAARRTPSSQPRNTTAMLGSAPKHIFTKLRADGVRDRGRQHHGYVRWHASNSVCETLLEVFGKAIHCLAKVGEDLFFEATAHKVAALVGVVVLG